MKDHNGVLMMQRVLLAGTLGLAMARKAAAILEGEPNRGASFRPVSDGAESDNPQTARGLPVSDDAESHNPQTARGLPVSDGAEPNDPQHVASFREPQGPEGAVLRAILDAANECLGHFDDRPAGERWCDTLFHLLDLAAFAAELG